MRKMWDSLDNALKSSMLDEGDFMVAGGCMTEPPQGMVKCDRSSAKKHFKKGFIPSIRSIPEVVDSAIQMARGVKNIQGSTTSLFDEMSHFQR